MSSPYIPFSQRPSWSDVTPIAQDDGIAAPASIRYSPIYEETFSYLRAVLASGETSARVFSLTGEAVELNASHYTAWALRRNSLFAAADAVSGGGGGVEFVTKIIAEAVWTAELVERKGTWKNYQVWHHRRLLATAAVTAIDALNDSRIIIGEDMKQTIGDGERTFCSSAFEDDVKNYHAWAHRQWVARILPANASGGQDAGWAAEATFAADALKEDIRNNSAWNHRWFALTKGGGLVSALPIHQVPPRSVIDEEIRLVLSALSITPLNESAWTHARALAQAALLLGRGSSNNGGGEGGIWAAVPIFLAAAHTAAATGDNAFALEVVAEAAEDASDNTSAIKAYTMAGQADPTRLAYWTWRSSQIR